MREMILAGAMLVMGASQRLAAGPNAALDLMGIFPLAGRLLRELSLGSAAGNTWAWVIYGLLCALPLLGLLPVRRKRGAADGMFLLASAYSLWLWRMLANPSRLTPNYVPGMEEIYGMMAGGLLLGLVLGGALLRLTQERETRRMVRIAEHTVTAFAMFAGYGLGLGGASLALGAQSAMDKAYAAVQITSMAAQTVALVWMLGGTSDLLSSVQWGWFDETNAALADELARRSRLLLLVTVFSSLAANAGAVWMAGGVTDSNVSIDLPVLELIAALCCMLLARFIREGVRIKAENDEFV